MIPQKTKTKPNSIFQWSCVASWNPNVLCFPATVERGCCPVRVQLATLMFFGFAVVYALRVNFSVAMVAMVNASDAKQVPNHSVVPACPLPSHKDNSSDSFLEPEGVRALIFPFLTSFLRCSATHHFASAHFRILVPQTPQYGWDPETQGWLLGAFFFGYLGTQILGGYLSGHYGGSVFLGAGVLGTAILTLLTPLAAQLGPSWLFALRALEGFGEVQLQISIPFSCKCNSSMKYLCVWFWFQGFTFPAMMAMWTRWAPPLERSRLVTFAGSGCNFGAFVAQPLTGYICQTLGWPAVFYICGEAMAAVQRGEGGGG